MRSLIWSSGLLKKRRAYDLVKTTFRFRLGLRCLHAAYDLVKTRLSESEPEAEKLNQSITKRGNMHCDWFFVPLLLPTPTIWFSLDYKRNVSDGVVSGIGALFSLDHQLLAFIDFFCCSTLMLLLQRRLGRDRV